MGQPGRVGEGTACGSLTCLGREVECRLFLDHRLALAGVRGEDRDGRGREHEAGARHERALVAVGRRLSDGVVADVEQRVGACGGEGGEDRQAERGAELLPGVQESGRQAGPVLADAGVRRRRDAREEAAEADRGDQQAGQDVRDIGAVGIRESQ